MVLLAALGGGTTMGAARTSTTSWAARARCASNALRAESERLTAASARPCALSARSCSLSAERWAASAWRRRFCAVCSAWRASRSADRRAYEGRAEAATGAMATAMVCSFLKRVRRRLGVIVHSATPFVAWFAALAYAPPQCATWYCDCSHLHCALRPIHVPEG